MSKRAEPTFPMKMETYIVINTRSKLETVLAVICDMGLWMLCGIGVLLCSNVLFDDSISELTTGGFYGMFLCLSMLIWCDLPLLSEQKRGRTLKRLLIT
ncbi:MAG: hypothetical protein LBM93_00535, partial [Oscillospiraceae bacterium]|nr:hypothetical protein [Oscillospiraceae bacterium]